MSITTYDVYDILYKFFHGKITEPNDNLLFSISV